MKKKELNKLTKKSSSDLAKDEAKLRADIEQAMLDTYAGKEKNLRKIKNLRHELAQVLTVKSIIEKSEASAKDTKKGDK